MPHADPTQELQQLPRFSASPVTLLGTGTYGSVYLVQDTCGKRSKKRAVKLIPRTKLNHNNVREVLNHYKLFGHAHVVGFREVLLTPNFLCIVMEYANKGTLCDHVMKLCKARASMPEHDLRGLFQQLIIAVDYFHSKGITNRDMKLDNLLLHEELPGRPLLLKVCDFGYSKDESKSLGVTRGVGTPCYMPPEVWNVLQGGSYDGKAVDVWCCGVVLYAMMWGKFPFGRNPGTPDEQQEMLRKMQSRSYIMSHQPDYSEGCKKLVVRMLEPFAAQRIKISEILEDAWFRQGLTKDHLIYNSSIPDFPRAQSLHDVIRVLREAVPRELYHEEDAKNVFKLLEREAASAGCGATAPEMPEPQLPMQ